MRAHAKAFVSVLFLSSTFLFLPPAASAQFGIKNTPFDTGTWKNVDPANKNSSVSKKTGSADKIASIQGGRYSVTLRNPTNWNVAYSLNGKSQISLMPGYRRTHTGNGKVQIKFDIGRGDGTFRSYSLGSGKTYKFVTRKHSSVGATAGGTFLDLSRD